MTQETDKQRLHRSLALIADAAPVFKDDWFLIGSAAAYVAGAAVENIEDIDLLLSRRDIGALKSLWAGRRADPPSPSDQFRSAVFYRFDAPLPIEAMADFEMRLPSGGWMKVRPKTRRAHGGLFAPSAEEQIALLKIMGREKDAPRIAALKEVREAPSPI